MSRQEHLFEVIQIVSGADLIMFSLMILNIVNDTEIFRIVSFSLHSVWLSGSIKHCQTHCVQAQLRPPVVSRVYQSLWCGDVR